MSTSWVRACCPGERRIAQGAGRVGTRAVRPRCAKVARLPVPWMSTPWVRACCPAEAARTTSSSRAAVRTTDPQGSVFRLPRENVLGELAPGQPGALDASAHQPVAGQPDACVGVPLCSDDRRVRTVGETPAMKYPVVGWRCPQVAEGAEHGCGDARQFDFALAAQ